MPEEVLENKDNITGGLRLLLCDRTSLVPPGFGMTKSAFVEAEDILNLHKATLSSFLVDATHARYLTRDTEGKLSKIGKSFEGIWQQKADVPQISSSRSHRNTRSPTMVSQYLSMSKPTGRQPSCLASLLQRQPGKH